MWCNHLITKHRATDLKFQKMQSANVKSAIIFTQLADKLVNLGHNRYLSQKEVILALSPLINICSEGLPFLSQSNQLMDQNCRTYLTSALPADLAPLAKDVPDNSDLLFGDNINTRISNIKTSYKALQEKTLSDYQKYKKPYNRYSKNFNRFPKQNQESEQGYQEYNGYQEYKGYQPSPNTNNRYKHKKRGNYHQ